MKINFENYGEFYCTLININGDSVDYRASHPHTLKECTDFIENRMSFCRSVILGVICDWNTGEIVATIEQEHEPDYSIYERQLDCDWGYNEDMGYDPYMGCYTDDC